MNKKKAAVIMGGVILGVTLKSEGAAVNFEATSVTVDYGISVSTNVGFVQCEIPSTNDGRVGSRQISAPVGILNELTLPAALPAGFPPQGVLIAELPAMETPVPVPATPSAGVTSFSQSSSTSLMGETSSDSDSDGATSVGMGDFPQQTIYGEIYSPNAAEIFWDTEGNFQWGGESSAIPLVKTYQIYRDGKLVHETSLNNFYDVSLREESRYEYEICAVSEESSWSLGHIVVRTPSLY